jgi:hypothetical protein
VSRRSLTALARAVTLTLTTLTCAIASARADYVVHEYIPADPSDDLRLGAMTSDGTMAAAIQTQSGPVASPEIDKSDSRSSQVYGKDRGGGSSRTYQIDHDTSRPKSVSYDDPFTPALAPYKREFAYDVVDDRLDLGVVDAALTLLSVGGAPRAADDQFYADLDVELISREPVRIPTVGPGARVLAIRTSPEVPLTLHEDSAENWFVKSEFAGKVRLVMHLAIDRAVFGSPFGDVEWPRLWRIAPQLPPRAKSEGIRVARQIGVVDGTGPSEAVRILVRHFRSFAPSNDRPRSTGIDLYRELATSRKGVCRHRSYAFVVTALALGIPSRFVRNEAHAWVEVHDGVSWHRIDLGGAADELDIESDGRVPHVPPRDPFEWPESADSGQAMADRSRAAPGVHRGPAAPLTSAARTAPVAPNLEPPPDADAKDERPRSTVTLKAAGGDVRRGNRLEISGKIDSTAGVCAQARVDLFLEKSGGRTPERTPLGTLVTNDEGRYEGRVVVPYGVVPGDYDVRATTPGSVHCGTGESP